MITRNEISRETAYQNLWTKLPFSENKTTFDIAKENGWLLSNNDTELLDVIREIIANFPDEVKDFQNGKTKITGFLMGQIMKKAKTRFQPQRAKMLLIKELKK